MKRLTRFTIAVCLATATAGLATNLITNRDFETGSIAPATTEYYPETAYGTWTMGQEGEYAVGRYAKSFHSAWAKYPDHTIADNVGYTGKMLVVNAAYDGIVPPYGDVSWIDIVWEQTAPVTPAKDYLLSYWLSSSYPENLAAIECSINDTALSPTADAPATVGVWQPVTYIWYSGIATKAKITLRDPTRIA